MNDNTYNGWTNYATWRVNLEIFDGSTLTDFGATFTESYELAATLKDYAESLIEDLTPDGLAKDYALAFLSYVDWREIAQHMVCAWADDERDEDEETDEADA